MDVALGKETRIDGVEIKNAPKMEKTAYKVVQENTRLLKMFESTQMEIMNTFKGKDGKIDIVKIDKVIEGETREVQNVIKPVYELITKSLDKAGLKTADLKTKPLSKRIRATETEMRKLDSKKMDAKTYDEYLQFDGNFKTLKAIDRYISNPTTKNFAALESMSQVKSNYWVVDALSHGAKVDIKLERKDGENGQKECYITEGKIKIKGKEITFNNYKLTNEVEARTLFKVKEHLSNGKALPKAEQKNLPMH